MPPVRLTLDQARAAWIHAQGLDAPRAGSIGDVVAATGWVRTLGGADVYLATRARVPGMTKAALEAANAAGDLHVGPAVRGCIYMVPGAHATLAMRIADDLGRRGRERDQEKAGIEPGELEALGELVLATLAKGPLSTDALRKAMPEGSVRSLGAAGKKVGLSSPLPSALRELEFAGRIERMLDQGRLDHERYLWRIPPVNPFEASPPPEDRVAASAELFLRQAGIATPAEFAAWSGFGQRDAKAAFAALPVVPVEIEGRTKDAVALEAVLPALRAATVDPMSVRLLSMEDNLLTIHGGPGVFIDPRHHGRDVEVWGMQRSATLGTAKHLSSRTILAGDRIIGIWEYDLDTHQGIWKGFDPVAKGLATRIDEAVAQTVGFLRDQLGHARSYAIDNDAGVRERAAKVRVL